MRRWLILVASLIVSGVFLWLALRDVPFSDVLNGIRQANLFWVALGFIGVFGSLGGRAVLWRGLLDNRLSMMQAFHILNITMLLNQLPLRAGEVVRTLLSNRSGIPIVTAATSIVIERLMDVVVVVVMLAVALSRLPNAPPGVASAATLFGIAAIVAFVVLILFARYKQLADRLLIWIENTIPALKRLNLQRRADEVLDGLRPLTNPRRAVHAIVWEIISWSCSLFTFYALERALNIQHVDLIVMALLGDALATFSIAIPVSVASIGPFEGAVRVAGGALNMTPLAATTLGFLYHGIIVIGLIAMGVSLGDMMAPPERLSDDATPA